MNPTEALRKLVDAIDKLDTPGGNDRGVTIMRFLTSVENARTALAVVEQGQGDDEEETYKIGYRDGYNEAVQDIDVLTGGDGEYRYCTDHDPDRHTPDAETMKQRIEERFDALQEVQPAPQGQDAQDAARYRWLRAGRYPLHLAQMILNDTPEGIDQSIDSAMKTGEQP